MQFLLTNDIHMSKRDFKQLFAMIDWDRSGNISIFEIFGIVFPHLQVGERVGRCVDTLSRIYPDPIATLSRPYPDPIPDPVRTLSRRFPDPVLILSRRCPDPVLTLS